MLCRFVTAFPPYLVLVGGHSSLINPCGTGTVVASANCANFGAYILLQVTVATGSLCYTKYLVGWKFL